MLYYHVNKTIVFVFPHLSIIFLKILELKVEEINKFKKNVIFIWEIKKCIL